MVARASAISKEADQSAEGIEGETVFSGRLSDKRAASTTNLPLPKTLALVEETGWRLAHVGYVYRETYSESRNKVLVSGQQIATSGEIVAIFLFRRSAAKAGER